MNKNNKELEIHKDLCIFKEEYDKKIEEFFKLDLETKVVFLNADYGLGKTTFVKNNLNIPDNCIYSPWLHKSDNYIEDIYYSVAKKNKSKISSIAIIITMIIAFLTAILGIVAPIITEIFKDNILTCKLNELEMVCTDSNNLLSLLLWILIPSGIIISLIAFLIYKKPVPLINFFKKENGKYYEGALIEKILNKTDKVLVIEDIDRIDNIEEVLIAINKISEYMKSKNINNKYILITGDYNRTIRRVNDITAFDNYGSGPTSDRNKGAFLMEKVVSLRIDFPSMEHRIDNVFEEYNMAKSLTKIERDEIIKFINTRLISVRLFIRFIDKYKDLIDQGYNIYYLLLEFYYKEKNTLSDERIKENTLYNTTYFPSCMNDIEMFLQCKKIKLPGMEYKKLTKIPRAKRYSDIITNKFIDIINEDEEAIKQFEFWNRVKGYPRVSSDTDDGKVCTIGEKLPIKEKLDEFLIGYREDELGMIEKRCYFTPVNQTKDFNQYKISHANKNKVFAIDNDAFIVSYIACFLRDNIEEIEANYPCIYKIIQEINKG